MTLFNSILILASYLQGQTPEDVIRNLVHPLVDSSIRFTKPLERQGTTFRSSTSDGKFRVAVHVKENGNVEPFFVTVDRVGVIAEQAQLTSHPALMVRALQIAEAFVPGHQLNLLWVSTQRQMEPYTERDYFFEITDGQGRGYGRDRKVYVSLDSADPVFFRIQTERDEPTKAPLDRKINLTLEQAKAKAFSRYISMSGGAIGIEEAREEPIRLRVLLTNEDPDTPNFLKNPAWLREQLEDSLHPEYENALRYVQANSRPEIVYSGTLFLRMPKGINSKEVRFFLNPESGEFWDTGLIDMGGIGAPIPESWQPPALPGEWTATSGAKSVSGFGWKLTPQPALDHNDKGARKVILFRKSEGHVAHYDPVHDSLTFAGDPQKMVYATSRELRRALGKLKR